MVEKPFPSLLLHLPFSFEAPVSRLLPPAAVPHAAPEGDLVVDDGLLARSLSFSPSSFLSSKTTISFFFSADPSEAPLLELSLACDNLLCDALGRAPSARLTVHAREDAADALWRKVAETEIVEVRK